MCVCVCGKVFYEFPSTTCACISAAFQLIDKNLASRKYTARMVLHATAGPASLALDPQNSSHTSLPPPALGAEHSATAPIADVPAVSGGMTAGPTSLVAA